jgi:hypothetical protein
MRWRRRRKPGMGVAVAEVGLDKKTQPGPIGNQLVTTPADPREPERISTYDFALSLLL